MSLKEKLDKLQDPARTILEQEELQKKLKQQTEKRELNDRIARNKDEYNRQKKIIDQTIAKTKLMNILHEVVILTKGKLEQNNWSYINFEDDQIVTAHKYLFIKWHGLLKEDSYKDYGFRINVHQDNIVLEASVQETITAPEIFDQTILESAIARAINTPGDYTPSLQPYTGR